MKECEHGVHSEPCPDCIKEHESDKPEDKVSSFQARVATVMFERRVTCFVCKICDDPQKCVDCDNRDAKKITALYDEREVEGWVVKDGFVIGEGVDSLSERPAKQHEVNTGLATREGDG